MVAKPVEPLRPPDVNEEVARQLQAAAELLEAQGADHFRVRACRRAAATVRTLDRSVADIYHDRGTAGLIAVPTIGPVLAQGIVDMIEGRRWRWLDRLQGDVDAEAVLATVAGVGPGLAARIHRELGIESLEDLELAAHDGRLATVPGFGPKRIRSVAECLAGRFRRGAATPAALGRGQPDSATPVFEQPDTSELLDVDAEYRREAAAGSLPRIAPRRFNPTGARWLPILHTSRSERHYTALYSNTARAHELGRTDDWVVIYADGPAEGQWTVVTERSGPNAGARVVRGRETEPG